MAPRLTLTGRMKTIPESVTTLVETEPGVRGEGLLRRPQTRPKLKSMIIDLREPVRSAVGVDGRKPAINNVAARCLGRGNAIRFRSRLPDILSHRIPSRDQIQRACPVAALHRSRHRLCYLTYAKHQGWHMGLPRIETKLALDVFSLGRDVSASWIPANRFAVLKSG